MLESPRYRHRGGLQARHPGDPWFTDWGFGVIWICFRGLGFKWVWKKGFARARQIPYRSVVDVPWCSDYVLQAARACNPGVA